MERGEREREEKFQKQYLGLKDSQAFNRVLGEIKEKTVTILLTWATRIKGVQTAWPDTAVGVTLGNRGEGGSENVDRNKKIKKNRTFGEIIERRRKG